MNLYAHGAEDALIKLGVSPLWIGKRMAGQAKRIADAKGVPLKLDADGLAEMATQIHGGGQAQRRLFNNNIPGFSSGQGYLRGTRQISQEAGLPGKMPRFNQIDFNNPNMDDLIMDNPTLMVPSKLPRQLERYVGESRLQSKP